MSSEEGKPTDQRSKLWRMMGWALPGSFVLFRTNRSLYCKLFPELNYFDTPKDRGNAFRKAQHHAITLNIRYCLFLLAYIAVIAVLSIGPLGLRSILRRYDPYIGFIYAFVMPASAFLPILIFKHRIQLDLRRQLVGLGRPICIVCGYNLTGNVSGRCPECGREIGRPGVGNTGSDNNAPLPQGDKTESASSVGRHGT